MGEVADWKQALADAAKQQKQVAEQQLGGDFKFISTSNGVMTIGDDMIPGNTLECVVLAAIAERTMYIKPYSADDIGPPDCFALGEEAKGLTVHENVDNPVSTGLCSKCPKAEFGTALQGKGPACKTRMRLMVMPASANICADDLEGAEMAMLKVSPTSVKNWNQYVAKIAGQGMPVWAVRTTISVAPHPKKQFEISFAAAGPIADTEVVPALYEKLSQADEYAMTPYSYEDE